MFYEVSATPLDPTIAPTWLSWLVDEHIPEVVRCGALSGRVVRLDEPADTYLSVAKGVWLRPKPGFRVYNDRPGGA